MPKMDFVQRINVMIIYITTNPECNQETLNGSGNRYQEQDMHRFL
jgi:hypothetical protein